MSIFSGTRSTYVSRRVDDDCLQELRWLYDLRDLAEARRDLAAWLTKWSGKYPKLTGSVEESIDETLTFYRLPRQHHKHPAARCQDAVAVACNGVRPRQLSAPRPLP
jgi:transposase-like protein